MEICSTEKEYLNQIIEPVRKCCKKYGYLPSVLIAQSCLENGYGIPSYWDNVQISALMKYNNMVGLKTKLLNSSWVDIGLSVWGGQSISKETPEEYNGKIVKITDSFRVYDNIEQSFADYLCFMTWGSNYGAYGEPKYGKKVLSMKDPETLIKKVSSLGYATGSTYPTSVMRIVKKHNLTKYDDLSGVEETQYYPTITPKKINTVAQALKYLGVNLIDRISVNASQVPAHNANSHEYFVVHYLGVNGENPNLYNNGFGGHYYVSKKGEVYQAALPTDKLWHVGASSGFRYIHPTARNTNCVGVECATYTKSGRNNDNETWYFTEKTQVSAAKLAASFMYVYGLDADHLLRHGDVTTKNCPSPYKRDEGKGTNWTWAEFKAKVQEYIKELGGSKVVIDTTTTESYTLRLGDKGDKVKALQKNLMLVGFAGCGYYANEAAFVTGVYDANTETYVKIMQTAANITVDGIFGKNSQAALDKYVKAATNTKVNFTAKKMLSTAKKIASQNKKNGFTYGDAKCLPSVSSADKRTSCDRFVDQTLWACGLKDIGNRSVFDVGKYLASKGAKKITDVNKIKAGDVMFTKSSVGWHTFILGNKVSNGVWERYDSGSKDRIQLTGAYAGYASQPFKEVVSGFQYAYRLPFASEAKKESTETTQTTTAEKNDNANIIYRVQTGAYSVKNNAKKMLARVQRAGLNAFIKDYGSKVTDRYSVQIGAYSIKANAEKKQKEAASLGIVTVIRKEKL